MNPSVACGMTLFIRDYPADTPISPTSDKLVISGLLGCSGSDARPVTRGPGADWEHRKSQAELTPLSPPAALSSGTRGEYLAYNVGDNSWKMRHLTKYLGFVWNFNSHLFSYLRHKTPTLKRYIPFIANDLLLPDIGHTENVNLSIAKSWDYYKHLIVKPKSKS